MKAYILMRNATEVGACNDDALAYVNGDGIIQIERRGITTQLNSAREARLLAYRLCEAAERAENE